MREIKQKKNAHTQSVDEGSRLFCANEKLYYYTQRSKYIYIYTNEESNDSCQRFKITKKKKKYYELRMPTPLC